MTSIRPYPNYIDECVDEFLRYLGLADQGYVGADIVSSVIADTVDMCTIRVSCTINAGSSVDESRYYVIDKSLGRIVEFSELFEEDSDYMSVISAEISRRIAARVEAGDFFYGYGIWTERPPFSSLSDYADGWSFGIDGDGRLIIAFDEDTVSPVGSASFIIDEDILADIADPDGLLGGSDS